MELYIANNEVDKLLKERKLVTYKTIVGNYMTSLEMAGFSVTLLKLDDELKELLDCRADTPAFKQL
jgi:dihydroxyacetone kinase-like protein